MIKLTQIIKYFSTVAECRINIWKPIAFMAFNCVDHNKLQKILKESGIQDHLTCLPRNLYAGQGATVRTKHGITDWFQIVKGVYQDCISAPCLFNFHAEYILQNAGLDEAQTGIKIAGKNTNNLSMQMTPPLRQKARGTKEPPDEVKEESEKLA